MALLDSLNEKEFNGKLINEGNAELIVPKTPSQRKGRSQRDVRVGDCASFGDQESE